MSDLKGTTNVICYENNSCRTYKQELVLEEPLAIRVEGNPYSVVMRTPGKEIAHTAGFCLAEGLVDYPDDFTTIGFCSDYDKNVITVTLSPERRVKVKNILERRGYISQTSCGICGKELVSDLYQILVPNTNKTKITIEQAFKLVDKLPQYQSLYKQTHASHAVMLLDSQLKFMSIGEDVGRHNALDKAIGEVFMAGNISKANIGILSSRISYELVQKAARAGISILISMSNPTNLAVAVGEKMNMTLACIKRKKLFIFCGKERIIAYNFAH